MSYNRELQVSLSNLFKARFPYVYIPTWEEKRVIDFIESIAYDETLIKHVRKVYSWSQTKGFEDNISKKIVTNTTNPINALDFIDKYNEDAIFIFKDLHVYFGVQGKPASYDVIRRMRDIIKGLHESVNRKNVVLVSPELIIPADMQKEISVFDFPLPNVEEILGTLNRIIEENGLNYKHAKILT